MTLTKVGTEVGDTSRSRKRLSIILIVLLMVTMFMGTGPGLELVNPLPGDNAFSVFGLPTIYAWAILWYAVELAIILFACFSLWRTDED